MDCDLMPWHDLGTASSWRGAGADPKVVQRILGKRASAATTMDLYGHLIDQDVWDAAARLDKLDVRRQLDDLGAPPHRSHLVPRMTTPGDELDLYLRPFHGASRRNRTDDHWNAR